MPHFSILYTSDTHGYLFPTDYASGEDRPMGLLKLVNAFDCDENTLVIDGGDTIQGSPFAGYIHRTSPRPHPCALAMNLGGYQYVTLGNHDFNMGLGALSDYLNDLDATCLCANMRDREGKLPIRPWAVHALPNGLRIGLVGACTHFVRRWERPETVALLEIEEPIPAIRRALEAVKPLSDATVLIYHGGFECDLSTGERLKATAENQACEICREMDFDVVLTGHQHMAVAGIDLAGTRAVQPHYRAPHYAQVDVEISDGKKRIESKLMPPAPEPLPAGMEALGAIERAVQRWLDTPAGHLDIDLPAGDPLSNALNGCAVANFVNMVQLDASNADISACSLPNEFKGIDRDVTVRDVVSTYIYSNTLKVLKMTGAVLRRYVERTASYFDVVGGAPAISRSFLRPKVEHYNYDYFSGMDYVLDLNNPPGSRATRMSRGGVPIRPEDELTVCVNSYRASGAGGYEMLAGLEVEKDIERDVAELLIEYIERNREIAVDKHRYLTVILPDGKQKRG